MQTLISPTIEAQLKAHILPELEKGRKDFDRPHTEAVVHWMKEILKSLPDFKTIDPLVMITAAYAHDWGYIGLFEGVNSSDPAVIKTRKPLHMERGADLIGNFLQDSLSAHYSQAQIEQIKHLVLMHDRVEDLHTPAELLIMEADTLGMLDTDLVKPTFSKADNDAFIITEIKNRREPRFIHPLAIAACVTLTKKRATYYN